MNAPASAPPSTILALDEVSRHFGSLRAVDEVSVSVARGERRAVIGPNGAGKTTLFNLIGGVLPVTSGRIEFGGRDITRAGEHRRARRGMARTFQHSNLFDGMPVHDNVATAVQYRLGLANRVLRRAARYRSIDDRVEELLEAVGLPEQRDALAGSLSHGERRQLEIAIALAIEPDLLLLDEPAAGMSAAERNDLIGLIGGLPAELTLILIEHDMDTVFAVATHITVMHAGRVLAEGSPDEVRRDPAVQEAYLGATEAKELFEV